MRPLLYILVFCAALAACFFLFSFKDKHASIKNAELGMQNLKAAEKVTSLSKPLLRRQLALDSLFSHDHRSGIFNGCVAVLYHDTVIYQGAFGYENISTKKDLCNESVFQLASVSKMFTAISVLKLAEEKKLALSDDISQYFPDFPYKNVKISNLLSHTSGLPNYLYFYYHLPKDSAATLSNARVMELMCKHNPPAYFKAGRRFAYNNTNYVVLALLVEKLSGVAFAEYVKQHIFIPAGMANSAFFNPVDSLTNQAHAFDYRKRAVGTDIFDYVVGDKGVCSTTGDMLKFAQHFFSSKIIADLAPAINPKVATSYGRFYGSGFRINPNGGDTIVFHNGWWHGYRSAFQYRKSDKTTIVILSNRLDKSVYHTQRIFNLLDNKAEAGALEEYSE